MLLVVATCLSMCACNLFSKKNSKDNEKNETGASDSNVISIQANDFDTAKYVGFWGIQEGREKQLTIKQQVSATVYFSLEYNSGATLKDCAAKLEGNIASFSIADSNAVIKGELEFHNTTITVRITHSTNTAMPAETMEFDRKYSSPILIIAEEIPTYTIETIPPTTTTVRIQGTDPTYILPYSNIRQLTYNDLYYLNASQLRIARNEIFARYGRMFDDASLQNYFNSKSWYTPRISAKNFSSSMLNSVEKKNVEIIEYWEKYGRMPGQTAATTPTRNITSSSYILPHSSTQLLTYNDIRGLSSYQLKLARNEIYARHGRMFTDSSLQSYFNSKSWYTPRFSASNFKSSMLSSIEKKNIEFIQSYE